MDIFTRYTQFSYIFFHFFFELIVTTASCSIPADFLLLVIVLKFNLIAVKLVEEEALFDLLWSYHAMPGIYIKGHLLGFGIIPV